MQDSSNSSALAIELLQSWTKPSIYYYYIEICKCILSTQSFYQDTAILIAIALTYYCFPQIWLFMSAIQKPSAGCQHFDYIVWNNVITRRKQALYEIENITWQSTKNVLLILQYFDKNELCNTHFNPRNTSPVYIYILYIIYIYASASIYWTQIWS